MIIGEVAYEIVYMLVQAEKKHCETGCGTEGRWFRTAPNNHATIN